jgi:hypothetical protein
VTWRAADNLPGVWFAEAVFQGVPLRSTALRLRSGQLAVYSPIRGQGEEAHRELVKLGVPALLVAPNHFHTQGLLEYARRYPGAAIAGASDARRRLARKSGRPVEDARDVDGALPPHVTLLCPPGTRAGELWLAIDGDQQGRAWAVGDAFFNVARTPRSAMGALLRLLGISPGLRIGASFRWLLRDREAYRRWLLEALSKWPPSQLVPCHGDILADGALPGRLRSLAEARL